MPKTPLDYDTEPLEVRMIDFPDTPMIPGLYTIVIVDIKREDGKLIAFARFAKLEEE
jgi:hypothetical protein